MPRLFHLADDGQADHVARGQLAARIVVGHEAVAVAIDQPRPFAARGLADQAAAAAGDVEHRGMELHELHVAQLGPGAIGHGHAVAGGHLGIGRFAVELARPAGGQDRLLGPDHRLAVPAVPHQRAAADAVVRQQIEREGVLPDVDVGRLLRRGRSSTRMTSLPVASPRAWTMRSWPCPPSRPSASRPPAWSNCVPQSISSPMRCGASRTTRSTTAAIAERAAGLERVGHVVLEAVVGIEHAGDAALGVVAVRLLDACPW